MDCFSLKDRGPLVCKQAWTQVNETTPIPSGWRGSLFPNIYIWISSMPWKHFKILPLPNGFVFYTAKNQKQDLQQGKCSLYFWARHQSGVSSLGTTSYQIFNRWALPDGNPPELVSYTLPSISHYLFLTETLQTDLFRGVQGEMNSHHMAGFPLLFSTRGFRNWSMSVYTVPHSLQQRKTATTWKSAMVYFRRLGLLSLRYSLVPWFFTPEDNSHASLSLTLPGTFSHSHRNFPLFSAYHHHKKEHPVT